MKNLDKEFMLLLRVVFGLSLLLMGLGKIMGGFDAAQMVTIVQRGGGVYASLTGLGNVLIPWGELLLGISLILGVSLRLSTTLGAVMFAIFWIFVGGKSVDGNVAMTFLNFISDKILIGGLTLLVIGTTKNHMFSFAAHKANCSNGGCPCKYLPN